MAAFRMFKRLLVLVVILIIVAAPDTDHVYAQELTSYEIPVTCRISPDIPLDFDLDFMYTLKAGSEKCPMPEGSEDGRKTVHVTDSGKVEFGKIIFDHPDVFHYTLQETTSETGAFRRDRTIYDAALIADANGNVRIVVNTDKGSKPEKIEFVNTYNKASRPHNSEAPRTGDYTDAVIPFLILVVSVFWLLMIRTHRKSAGEILTGRSRTVMPDRTWSGQNGSTNHRTYGYLRSVFVCLACTAFVLSIQWSCEGQAYAAVSTADDYSKLPVNYVEIGSLDFSKAVFTPLNSSIKKTTMEYYLSEQNVKHSSICWVSSSKPKFGSSNASATQNANLGNNTISGDLFTLRFSEAAILTDGTKKDILMTFSDLYFGLSKNINNTSGSNYYYPIIRIAEDGSGRYCNSGIGINTKNSGRIKGVRAATRIKTTIRIVEPGTDQCIEDMDYIIGFRDLDVKDNTTATGDNIDRYAGHYSEGIGLISGYSEPVYLCKGTHIRQDTWDGVTKLRGTQGESGGIVSGFDIAVTTSGFMYYWYGSHNVANNTTQPGGGMGTLFGYSPEVNVLATAGNGGTIEKPGVTKYIVNSSTGYSYEPSEGYKVRKLTVDGKPVPFDPDGGLYLFDKLTETNEEDYDHTIEVSFHKPQDLIISKNVKGSLGDRKKEFAFTVYLTDMEEDTVFDISDTSTGVFTGVYIEGTKISSRQYRTTAKGKATLKLTLKDDQFIRLSALTGGAKYSVREEVSDHVASYRVSGDGADPVIVSASKANTGTGAVTTAAESVDEGDGLVQIMFSNEKSIVPPTGVRTGNKPLALTALIASAVILLILAVHAAFRAERAPDDSNP